jgi:hypothetical protein
LSADATACRNDWLSSTTMIFLGPRKLDCASCEVPVAERTTAARRARITWMSSSLRT